MVIPAFNAEGFIGAAIRSVRAQTAPVLEIIVVDDGSVDDTARVARHHRARVLRRPHGGPGAARNAGVHVARGAWIAFLDADDRWLPQKLEAQLELARRAGLVLVSCDHTTIAADGTRERSALRTPRCAGLLAAAIRAGRNGLVYPSLPPAFFHSGWAILPSTALVRAPLARELLFNPALPALEDYEFFMRVLARHAFGMVDRPLVRYRLHDGNLHFNEAAMRAGARMYRELVSASPHLYPAGAIAAVAHRPAYG